MAFIIFNLFSTNVYAINCKSVFTHLSKFSPRLILDKSIYFSTLEFYGKPEVLHGVQSLGIKWDPHSLKFVFYSDLDEASIGRSTFSHTLGKISVSIYQTGRMIITINPLFSKRYIALATIENLLSKYPDLNVYTQVDRMSPNKIWTPVNFNVKDKLIFEFLNEDQHKKLSNKPTEEDTRLAVQDIFTTLLNVN